MNLVIDSSITLGWDYDDERTTETDHVLELVAQLGAWVPAIWPLEVANALQQGIRRRRIDAAFRDGALADLSQLKIRIDPDINRFAWTATLAIAQRFRLTPYDACYVELAERRALTMASLDDDMRRAASALGVPLL